MFNAAFSTDIGSAIEKLSRLPDRAQKAAGHVVANEIRRGMHELSMTPDGVTYPRYTKPYARYREAHGRQTAKVDLKFTGEYGRDIQPRKDGDDIVVSPKESDLPRAAGLSKKRPHIGLFPEVPGIIESKLPEIFNAL